MVSNNSHSSRSVSDSGCSAKQLGDEELPSSASARKKRCRSPSSPRTSSPMEKCGSQAQVSEAPPADAVSMEEEMNVATHPVQQQQPSSTSWWLNQRSPVFPLPYPPPPPPPPPPGEENYTGAAALIRPTTLVLRGAEAADALPPNNTTLFADVNMVGSNPRNFSSRIGGETGTGGTSRRKSFVEWKPMVTSSTETNTPAKSLQLASSWSFEPTGAHLPLPNMNLPPLGPGHAWQGEERQLRFRGTTGRDKSQRQRQKQEAVAVVMEGRSVELGSICLHHYDGYRSLAAALRSMFAQSSGSGDMELEFQQECNLATAIPEHIVAYEDDEGDLLLAGDLSWRRFVRKAKRIRILPSKGRNVVAVP